MELTGEKIQINETVFDGFAEKTAECDYIVPDYYPDISKVVKTEAMPRIKSKMIMGDRLTIEGVVEFRIMYMPEKSAGLKCLIFTCDFSQTFDIRNMNNAYVKTAVKVENVNTRVLNPRKLSPRALLLIAVKVWSQRDCSVITPRDYEDVEIKTKNLSVFSMIASAEKPLIISDDLEFSSSMPAASSILKNDINIIVSDVKLINNKAITRGSAKIKTLYVTDDETSIETAENEIPFTQIIDIEGVNEDCSCDIKYEVSECAFVLKDNENGEGRIISADIECTADVRAFKNDIVQVVSDAYSINYDCRIDEKTIIFEKILSPINEDFSGKESIDLEETISLVADMSLVPVISSVSVEEGNINFEGALEVSILAFNSEKEAISLNKSLPFKYAASLKESFEDMRFEPDISVKSVSFTLVSDTRIDVRYELNISSLVFSSQKETIADAISTDESSAKAKPNTAAVTLYFAKVGESIWDIAKQYNTSQEAIKSANGADYEVMPCDSTLIIPKRKY